VAKKPKHKEVEFEIKVKGDDGQVHKYNENEEEDNESGEDSNDSAKAAKKVTKKSTNGKSKIQSEETLEMLMNAMKP